MVVHIDYVARIFLGSVKILATPLIYLEIAGTGVNTHSTSWNLVEEQVTKNTVATVVMRLTTVT